MFEVDGVRTVSAAKHKDSDNLSHRRLEKHNLSSLTRSDLTDR